MSYRYCPGCAVELVTRHLDDQERQTCPRCGFIYYPHSSPCVGVLLVKDQEVLLVARATDPFQGYWDIPGGFLEAGEHPEAGAVREMREETGLLIQPTGVLGIWMDVYGPEQTPTLNICYLARLLGGEPVAGSDAASLRWHPLDELPSQIAFAWEHEALALLRERPG